MIPPQSGGALKARICRSETSTWRCLQRSCILGLMLCLPCLLCLLCAPQPGRGGLPGGRGKDNWKAKHRVQLQGIIIALYRTVPVQRLCCSLYCPCHAGQPRPLFPPWTSQTLCPLESVTLHPISLSPLVGLSCTLQSLCWLWPVNCHAFLHSPFLPSTLTPLKAFGFGRMPPPACDEVLFLLVLTSVFTESAMYGISFLAWVGAVLAESHVIQTLCICCVHTLQ